MPVDVSKTLRELQAAASHGAGATTTGAAVDVRTGLGMVVTAKVSNGASGPTLACEFIVQISGDGTTWWELSRQQAGTDAHGVHEFIVEIPAAVMWVRSVFTGNTGQAVTVEAVGQELTGIG